MVWVNLDPTQGRETSGRRPALVISSDDHLLAATTLVVVVPCTTRDRDWASHVRLTGDIELAVPTFAMTEQPRVVSRSRVVGEAGVVSEACLAKITAWVHRWLAGSR